MEKWGCLKARIIQRKLTLLNVPWLFLFPPPPRPEKNIHNLPKTSSH
jgi:CHASE1-domain containing sensor protein